jgi:hypothetical protein
MILVKGAYGRKYDNKENARKDWDEGKDFFMVEEQCYCSVRDFTNKFDYITIYLVADPFPIVLQRGVFNV